MLGSQQKGLAVMRVNLQHRFVTSQHRPSNPAATVPDSGTRTPDDSQVSKAVTGLPVAFCITELDPGGAERALVETVTRLDPTRFVPHVYCLGPEAPLVEPLRTAGIAVTCYGASVRNVLGVVKRLRRDLVALSPALVMTSLVHANIVGRFAAEGLRVPVVAGHRVAEKGVRWHLWAERLTGHRVTHHVAVSESVRQHLIESRVATDDNSSVIYNGVDVHRFATAEPAEYSSEGPIALFAGRLDRQKGLEILFEAWPGVEDRFPTARLVLAGDGPLRQQVEQFATRRGVENIGFQADIAPWFKRADVVVLPSRWEGLPNVLLEALAAGTPCVASEVEGVAEVFGETRSTIISPNDPRALMTTLCDVLSRPDYFRDQANSLQVSVQERFTWDRTAAETTALLDRLITPTH